MARKKLPFLVLAALMGASAVYFVAYVEPRSDDLVELDFRRLAAMAERIDMQLATYRQVVTHAAQPPHVLPPPLEWRVPPPPAKNAIQAGAKEPEVSISEEITPGRLFIFKAGPLQASLRVDELAGQALEKDAFDKLILANSKGDILHQEGRGDIHLTSLYGLGIEAKDIARRARATGLYDAELSGRSYKVFVQPCSTPRVGNTPEGWVLYALVSAPRFHWRALQISPNWLILFSGVALLAFLSLPFLKLLTLGPGARLRAIDGLLAGLCALIALSVLTVLLLDLFIYRGKLETGKDGEADQVRHLAGALRVSLRKEIDRALVDFAMLRTEASRRPRKVGKNDAPPEALDRHSSFFWADKFGEQIFKWTARGQATPTIPIGDRAYFRNALRGHSSYGRASSEEKRVSLESIRSWTTGEDQLAIATLDGTGAAVGPDQRARRSVVAAMTTRLESVHGASFPPGFGFAVIDSTGRVLFHSERRRMLQENFLDEADSQALRALVASGRAGAEKISYLGRRHRAYLEPMPELSWSVIAFRDMRLLRATNVQIVTTTLACLVLYAALFLTLFSAVYMSSSTRARWLWPDASRHGTYLQLGLFYIGCLVVYLYLLSEGNPVFLFVDGMMIPLLVLFISYVKVRSDQRLLDHKQVGALVAVVMLLVISALAGLPGLDPAGRLLALVSLVLSGLLLFLPIATRFFVWWRPASLRTAYLCAAALLLMVLSILPAASFFKLACDVPLENMIKLGQWTLMRQLDDPQPGRNYSDIFFQTRESASPEKEKKTTEADLHLSWFLDYQEEIFPIYNEHSRILARLSPDSAEGWPWYWAHKDKNLWLHRDAEPGRRHFDVVSSFPAVKPRGAAWLGLGAGILALGLMSFGLVWLMAHNLMLLGSNLPLWLDRRRLDLGTSVIHRIYVSQRPERLRIPARPYIQTIDISSVEAEVESGSLLKRPIPSLKRLIVVKGFEHRIEEPAFNWGKLRLLETLAGHGARRVLLLSSQDPFLLLNAGFLVDRGDDPERELEEQGRWRELLARFAVVDLDGREEDAKSLAEKLEKVRKRPLTKAGRLYLSLIEAECSPTSRLQGIGIELLSDLCFGEASRRGSLNEILVRAESYYTDLWKSLPDEERLALVQLAEEGLANPKNLRPLQRLIARGLVCCDPAPRLMNETFRLFVSAVAAKEDVRRIEAKHEEDSTWGQLKVPLTATLLGGIVFFGFTQQETLSTTLSVITIATGAMPHLLQLVGYLGATKVPLPPVR